MIFNCILVFVFRGQFGGDQNPGQTSRRKNVEKSSTRSKNTKNSQVDSVSEQSGQWVTPKSSAGLQKNAGSRRVQAVSGGSGHWYTGQDGRRVSETLFFLYGHGLHFLAKFSPFPFFFSGNLFTVSLSFINTFVFNESSLSRMFRFSCGCNIMDFWPHNEICSVNSENTASFSFLH